MLRSSQGLPTSCKIPGNKWIRGNGEAAIYFDECNKLGVDVLIVLDSDEYILPTATNWDLFHLDLLDKIIPMLRNHKATASLL